MFMPATTMNDPDIPSSSFLHCFDFKPDPLAWSFVRQTLISVFNINDFAKEAPKSSISDLESVLKDVKLLTTFQKGNTTNVNLDHSNEGRSNEIKLSNDYAEDEIESLKIVSTCLVPESNNYKMENGLQEGPTLTEKGPLVSKDDNSIAQDFASIPTNSNDISKKAPTVAENVYVIMQDGCPIDENGNTNMAKELPVMENADQIMPNGCPIDETGNTSMPKVLPVMENADQIMLDSCPIDERGSTSMPKDLSVMENADKIMPKDQQINQFCNAYMPKVLPVKKNADQIMLDSCPIDENGSTSMPKDLPVMENADQIMPKDQQINQFCNAYMPKVHPTAENGDRNIPKQHPVTENNSGNMQGPSLTGNVDRNLQAPAENDNGGTLPRNFCLKCHRGGSLIMCEVENCFTSFHERCAVYLERSELGTFKCPLCFYKHTAMAYQVAKKRYSQAKKSLACFLVKDELYNRINKRKSAKANGDMNASGNNRKHRKKTEIQVKVEAVETEVGQNGSEANGVQAQAIKGNTVTLDKGKSKADLSAVNTINGTHEKGEATIIKSKDMPQEVLNMPVHKARVETIPSGGGRNPRFSNSENQHTGTNSRSKNREKSSCNDKRDKRPSSEVNEHQARLQRKCNEKTSRYHAGETSNAM